MAKKIDRPPADRGAEMAMSVEQAMKTITKWMSNTENRSTLEADHLAGNDQWLSRTWIKVTRQTDTGFDVVEVKKEDLPSALSSLAERLVSDE